MAAPSALLDTLVSYASPLLVRRLADETRPLTDCTSDGFVAAVLSIDIVGFTPLAEWLAEHSPTGAETLSDILNDYFGRLIDLLTEHGGEVARFAGDALLVLWVATPKTLAAATHRAAWAAQMAQNTLGGHLLTGGTRLAVRIGVAAGEVQMMHVGRINEQWKVLVSGHPIIHSNLAEREAAPGEVVLSPRAWGRVRAWATGRPLPTGGVVLTRLRPPKPRLAPPLPRLQPAMGILLQRYLPRAIRARLAAGQSDWLAEHRLVTVLFLALPDLNPSTSLDTLQGVVERLQTLLYHYGASLNQLHMDDKGLVVLAALGVPPLTHEDDAARGVRVALASHAALTGMGLRCAIGITTGRAFCGSIGNDTRREYTMLGDCVNLAARLMQRAPNEIWCDGATVKATREQFAFETLAPLHIKGKRDTVAVYRPLAPQEKVPRPLGSLVGRMVERRQLLRAVEALLAHHRSSTMVLEGEAGIGKSRLVAEVTRQAEALGARVLLGAGDAMERTTPYAAWRSLMQNLFALDPLADPSTHRAHLQALLADDPALLLLLPLLQAVIPLNMTDNERTAPLMGANRAAQTQTLIAACLQRVAQRTPLVLILEDAHWLDSASWALTRAVQQISPLLLLLVTRPLAEVPLEAQPLLVAAETIVLDGLPPDEVRALITKRLKVPSVPDALVALVVERAQGHPFFSEELVYALRDGGLLRVEEHICEVMPDVDLRTVDIPNTVQGIITSRIDHLPAPHQLTLKAASVIGRSFPFRLLAAVHPVAEDVPLLPTYLDLLERLHLTPVEFPEPNLTYLFKHVITQEVAYHLMLATQRQQLHRRTGEAIEELFAGRLDEHVATLALHFERAQMWNKALPYFLRAGDDAARLFAYAEARQHYSQALAALSQLEETPSQLQQRVDTLLKLVNVSLVADSPQANITRLDEAERLMERLAPAGATSDEDGQRLMAVRYALGRAYYYYTHPLEALQQFEAMEQLAHHLGGGTLLAVPTSMIGRVLSLQGFFEQALPRFVETFAALEATGNWSDWLWNQGYLGFCLCTQGEVAVGLAAGERALAMAQEKQHPTAIAVSYIFLTMDHWQAGNLEAGLATGQACIETARQSGDWMPLHLAVGFRAWLFSRQGEHAAAQAAFEEYRALAQRLGGRPVYADWFAAAAAELAWAAGDSQEALTLAQRAVAFAQAINGLFAIGIAERIWGLALASLEPDNWEEAERHLAASVAALQAGNARLEVARTHLAWGRAARARQEDAAARTHLLQALAQFRASGMQEEAAQAESLLASSHYDAV